MFLIAANKAVENM